MNNAEHAEPELNISRTVALAQTGDRAAFEALYEHFAEPLFRFLYARCADATQAEDLSSELWVRVVERLPAFRFASGAPDKVFVAWLYQIARNLVIDTQHRRRTPHVPLSETVVSRDAAPEEQALAAEERRELQAAMEQLTEDQRAVLMLRFIEERSNAEVGNILDKTEGSVKLLQYRALGTLARMLGTRRGRQ